MKLSRIMAVSAACLLLCALISSQVYSQGVPIRQPVAPQAGAGANIALLDVSYIFKNHPRFKQMMDEMKTDVEAAESSVTKERDTIRKLVEQLDTYHKGSPDYNAMEKEIAEREANLSVKVQLQRKEFLGREAKIYLTVYKEIEDEVKYYCQNKGIDIVLRFNGDPADVDKPDSVLSFINKPVVYYDANRDITKPILDTLIMRSGGPAAGGNRIGNQRGSAANPFQPQRCNDYGINAPHSPRTADRAILILFHFNPVTDDRLLWMFSTRKQRTLMAPAMIEGVGYWSGRDVKVEFCPAPADTGIVFVRRDLPGSPRIAARIENRTETPLRTTLRAGDVSVEMIEHLMSALAGMQIDNCEIRVDRPEMPGVDGSSLPFVEAFQAAGIVEQDAVRRENRFAALSAGATSKAGSKPGPAARER